MTRWHRVALHAPGRAALLLTAACAVASAQAPPSQSLVALDAVWISDVVIEGSTVFTADELRAFVAPYENRLASFEDLQTLRQMLSQAYVERGYLTSGVVIPEQDVADGRVVLRAVENELTRIVVEGNRRLRDRPTARRVAHHVGAPLNIVELQDGLRILQKDPLVERVNASLQPGPRVGQSELHLDVAERPPFEFAVVASNDRSASVGEHHVVAQVNYHGLLGNGDVLRAHLGGSNGAGDNLLAYRVPLTAGGIALDLGVSDQNAVIVEQPFATIDIESRIATAAVGVSRPFVDAADRTLTGSIALERKRSESTLLGVPFSFSAGDVDGKARGSAVIVGVEWSRRVAARAWAARGSVQLGIDAFDATRNATGPDSKFTLWQGQFEYAERLSWRDGKLLARGVLQIAHDPLLAMYKLPVGGSHSVRGYRESRLVRDSGLAATLEYQFAALLDASGQRRGKLDLALFADVGLSVDEDELLFATQRERLSSVGFGLLWDPLPGLHAEIYRGFDLRDAGGTGDSLQDRGIHYALTFQRAF
jgi:hemolysin activation/secretion protein